MTDRRWYPTVTTLSNGKMLVISGQKWGGAQSTVPEVWTGASGNNGTWGRLTTADRALKSYPWMFAAPNGRVFCAGPERDCRFLNTTGTGAWESTVFNTAVSHR